MTQSRLTSVSFVTSKAQMPQYDLTHHKVGIMHIGVGAFHRSHQAVYTDDALAKTGGDWRILGVSMRSKKSADALNPQNGLYCVVERSAQGDHARVIGSIEKVLTLFEEREEIFSVLISPKIKIVSLTVTEKAYCLDRKNGGVNMNDPIIVQDLRTPKQPESVIGLLCEGLRLRKEKGIEPYTVLSCDNLSSNGQQVKLAVVSYSKNISLDLSKWIDKNVMFPCTMVDRITPASNAGTYEDAAHLIGFKDLGAVETEVFKQWVIEDCFSSGRPDWDAGGAMFVDDVVPYELMKLRMLNGSHSLIAYLGVLLGHKFVRDVMNQPMLRKLVNRHLQAAMKTLNSVNQIDFIQYSDELIERFSDLSLAHETKQIAMDGSEKIPQRIIEPAIHALDNKQDFRTFAFTTALWMRYILEYSDNGSTYTVEDPRIEKIRFALKNIEKKGKDISLALHTLDNVFPNIIFQNKKWMSTVAEILSAMLEKGVETVVKEEAF
jgi:fructuronate reductase